MQDFVRGHVHRTERGPELETRTVDTYLRRMDPSRMLLTRAEVRAVNESMRGVFDRIRAGDLTLRDLKKELERYCVERALEETSGNISQAAHLLGLKRPRMSQLVKEFAIRANGEER